MSVDYVVLAKTLLCRMKQEIGTGRTHILREGFFQSDNNPTLVAPTRHQAANELHSRPIRGRIFSFKEVEMGRLQEVKGPTILSHTAIEDLIDGLLHEIDTYKSIAVVNELEVGIKKHTIQAQNAKIIELTNALSRERAITGDLRAKVSELESTLWEHEND